jgi:hypothetical protein
MDGPSAHPTSQAFTIVRRDVLRPLREIGVIAIPNARDSDFDHAAFDPKTRRVFIAHTARDCLEVVDHDSQRHIATLPGFPGVAARLPMTARSSPPTAARRPSAGWTPPPASMTRSAAARW